MDDFERRQRRLAREAEQAERDRRAKEHAAAHPKTEEEQAMADALNREFTDFLRGPGA